MERSCLWGWCSVATCDSVYALSGAHKWFDFGMQLYMISDISYSRNLESATRREMIDACRVCRFISRALLYRF